MLQVHDQTKFHEDGTPKRKYELDELKDEVRMGFRASVGLVVFSTVVLLKNVFYGGDNTAGNARGQEVLAEQERGEARSRPTASDDATVDLQDSGRGAASGESEEPEPLARGFTPKVGGSGPLLIDFEVPRPGRGPLSSLMTNDNAPVGGTPAPLFFPLSEPPLPSFSRFGGPAYSEPASIGKDLPPGSNAGDDTDDPVKLANRRPYTTGYVSLGTLLMNTAIVFTWTDFLRRVMDPDGDELRLLNLAASSGKLIQNDDGTWRFAPDYGDSGYVTFTYRVSDGQEHVWQTAYLDLVAPRPKVIDGTNGDDVLIGTPEADTINALAGDDTIVGREDDDVIFGGDGNDRILAGDGNDVVYGGAGDDFILAGSGDDTVYGEDGDDTIYGEEGRDVLSGGDGNDFIDGGEGDDIIDGGAGNDFIYDGAGKDYVNGGGGNDTFKVSRGNDIYDGGTGKNTIDATDTTKSVNVVLAPSNYPSTATSNDAGDEEEGAVVPGSAPEHFFSSGENANIIDPGSTTNVVNVNLGLSSGYSPTAAATIGSSSPAPTPTTTTTTTSNASTTTSTSAPPANTAGWAIGEEIDQDQLFNIQNVITGSGDDDVTGNHGDNEITTNDGDDKVDGEGGDDKIDTGNGDDRIDAGSGNDTIDAGEGDDTVLGGKGNDTVDAGKGDDMVDAGSGKDTVEAGEGDDTIYAGSGDDAIDDGAGNDEVNAGSGNDIITVSAGDDDIDGGEGWDTFDARTSDADIIANLLEGIILSSETGNDTITRIEVVLTGSGDDDVCGDDERNEIRTGSGRDFVDDGDGDDRVDTGGGNDVIIISLGDDYLDGGDDFDILDASETTGDIYVDLMREFAFGVDFGRDTLRRIEGAFGGSGDDTFVADDEQNVFAGGDGNDTFVFLSSRYSRSGEGERDVILDFEVGDRLDLDGIADEFENSESDDFEGYSFRLISSSAEFSKPGELRLRYDDFEEAQAVIVLDGNTDDDEDIDFQIEFRGELDQLEELIAGLFERSGSN